MTKPGEQPKLPELDDAIRRRILAHAAAINGRVLTRLATVADDLDAEAHRAALGGIDGIEREIQTMRSFLLLLP